MPDRTYRSIVLLCSGVLLGLIVAGYGLFTAKGTRLQSVPPEDLALVNGRPILRSDFITQVQTQYGTAFANSSPQQRAAVFQDMITEELMVQRGLEIDLPASDPEVRASLAAGVDLETSADVLSQQPAEAQLRDYYLANRDRYRSEGVMRLRDLIVDGGLAAAAIQSVQALRRGRAVEEVMRAYGLRDSGRLLQGGKIDTGELPEFAVRVKLPPAVYVAASALGAGEVSDPIPDAAVLHIVVMLARRPSVAQPFEQVADQVWVDLQAEERRRVHDANVNFLRRRADIQLSADAQGLSDSKH